MTQDEFGAFMRQLLDDAREAQRRELGSTCGGLTKREYAAIHIMASFARFGSPAVVAKTAVEYADALLAALSEEERND